MCKFEVVLRSGGKRRGERKGEGERECVCVCERKRDVMVQSAMGTCCSNGAAGDS